jgi:hypothetical protein
VKGAYSSNGFFYRSEQLSQQKNQEKADTLSKQDGIEEVQQQVGMYMTKLMSRGF